MPSAPRPDAGSGATAGSKAKAPTQAWWQLRPGSPLNHLKNQIGNLLNPTGPKYNAPPARVPVAAPVPHVPSPIDRITQLQMALQAPKTPGGQAATQKYLSPQATSGNNRMPQSAIDAANGVKTAPAKTAPAKPAPSILGSAHSPAAPRAITPASTSGRSTTATGQSTSRSLIPTVRTGSPAATGHSAPVAPAIDPFTGKATSAVDAELNPALNELQRQIDAANAAHAQEVADANARQARAQGDLSTMYDHLGNFTRGLQGVQDTGYGTTEKTVGGNYAQLQQQLAQNFGARTADTSGELSRLGIDAVGPAATSALGRDQGYLQGLSSVNATNANSNLESQRSGFDALMSMMQGNAATEGTVQRGQSARDAANVLAKLNQAYNLNNTSLTGKKGDIAATRGTKIQQMVDALKAQDASAKQAAETAAFNRALAQANLGIKQGGLTLAQQKAAEQSGLTAAQIAHLTNSDAVARQNANTASSKATAAAATKTAKTPKPPSGTDGGLSIINALKGPEKQDVLNEYNTVLHGTYSDDLGPNGKPGVKGAGAAKSTDPVTVAHLNTWLKNNTTKNLTQADVDAILRALDAYNNKIGHA